MTDYIDDLFGKEPPEWEQELMQGAWQILHDEPGTEREDWIQELLAQYPTEVVDTFGTNPPDAFAMMDDWWDSKEYEDPITGINETYKDWALIFANEMATEVYDTLSDKIRSLEGQDLP